VENLLKELKEKETRIDNLEKVVLLLTQKVTEITTYIQDNDHKVRGKLKLLYNPPNEESAKPLKEVLDSLHERLNMLESGSPSDN